MELIKKLRSYYYLSVNNKLYCAFFLMGILMGLLFYFKTESSYEDSLFNALADDVREITQNGNDSLNLLINSLHTVHKVIASRQQFFNKDNITGFKAGMLEPVSVDLMTGKGSCGSYSLAMARLMKNLGFNVRIAQMKVGEIYAGHNLVEIYVNGNWVVVDALYDLFFLKPDGDLASFKDVQQDWNYYKRQVPSEYDMAYKYEDLRYTNWDKIPVVMPLVKQTLSWTLGAQRADEVSIRMFTIRKFDVFFKITLGLFLATVGYTIFLIRKKKRMAAQSRSLENTPSIETKSVAGKVTILQGASSTPIVSGNN